MKQQLALKQPPVTVVVLLFLLMVVMQWLLPVRMIWQQHSIARQGELLKFKVLPLDPIDALRGRYLRLRFEADRIKTSKRQLRQFKRNSLIYVLYGTDKEGFAQVQELSNSKPKDGIYLKTRIGGTFISKGTIGTEPTVMQTFQLPFERFYLQEGKALRAEKLLQAGRLRPSEAQHKTQIYALVALKNGQAALQELYIDNVPIGQYLEGIR